MTETHAPAADTSLGRAPRTPRFIHHEKEKGMTTSFTRDNTVLLLVDHQTAVMDRLVKVPPLEDVKANTVALARAARLLGVPIVLSCNIEQYNGILIPELEKATPDEYHQRIERQGTVNAFDDPRVSAAVRATGRTHLVMAAIGS